MGSAATSDLLVASYLIRGLANVNEDLDTIVQYAPLHFYQGGSAMQGLDWDGLVIIVELAALFCLLACWRFLERDLRVEGEDGWKHQDLIGARGNRPDRLKKEATS